MGVRIFVLQRRARNLNRVPFRIWDPDGIITCRLCRQPAGYNCAKDNSGKFSTNNLHLSNSNKLCFVKIVLYVSLKLFKISVSGEAAGSLLCLGIQLE